jgi:hypothetical protein
MKKESLLLIVLLMMTQSVLSQNWNVFNHNYRYNYKYDGSTLISNVLFVDSTYVTGTDTIYYLNRIGVPCTGSCPTLTASINLTSTIVLDNMPQFLQRSIKKVTNGLVLLIDTAKLVLKPGCQPSQTWLFDSINSKSGICLSKTSQINFGINDSIKTILVAGTDTIKLSKLFGILQFPNLYNKNKYYRLVGIENASNYDSTALFGIKVPNAWDFYNYDIGDRFCYSSSTFSHPWRTCHVGNFSVIGKTISGTGYSYQVDGFTDTCNANGPVSSGQNIPYSYSVIAHSGLSSPSVPNTMYPGQIISGSSFFPAGFGVWGRANNIVRFGIDNHGTFYKYAGTNCLTFNNVTFPFNSINTYTNLNNAFNGFYELDGGGNYISVIYGVGLGNITTAIATGWPPTVLDKNTYCLQCAVKKNTVYFGTETFVSVKEEKGQDLFPRVFPNPSSGKFYFNLSGINVNEIKVFNLLGQEIASIHGLLKDQIIEVDIRSKPDGLYFIKLLNGGNLIYSEKILKN